MLRRSHVLMLVAGIAIGTLVIAPAGATIRNDTTTLWNKLKPLSGLFPLSALP